MPVGKKLSPSTIEHAIRHSGIHLNHRGLLNELHGRIFVLTARRLPWLLVGLVGGLAASVLVSRFEATLREVVELAFFSPAVVYMGDAVGSQTQALFVRAITVGDVRLSKFLLKDLIVNGLIGVVVAGLSFLAIVAFLRDPVIAAIVAFAMFGTVICAGLVAILMTVILTRKKEDPALGAGPFATIVQDIVSITVYFAVATFVLTFIGR